MNYLAEGCRRNTLFVTAEKFYGRNIKLNSKAALWGYTNSFNKKPDLSCYTHFSSVYIHMIT